jgi:surfactin synthase thioesterase subunit/non-ribosomal peptide synthetase component F
MTTTQPAPMRSDPVRSGLVQEGIWISEQLADRGADFHQAFTLRLTGALRVDALSRACEAVLDRHHALRTTLVVTDGQPWQVPDSTTVRVATVDGTGWSAGRAESRLRDLITAKFPLDGGPLIRLYLVTRDPNEHILLVVAHHLVFDANSREIMASDIVRHYRAFVRGEPVSAPALGETFVEQAVHTRDEAEREAPQAGQFWHAELAGCPRLTFPYVPEVVVNDDAPAITFTVDRALFSRITELADRQRIRPFHVLLAAVNVLMFRYGNPDVLIAVSADTRTETNRHAAGLFANEVPLRTRMVGAMPASQLIDDVAVRARRLLKQYRTIPIRGVLRMDDPDTQLPRVVLSYRRRPAFDDDMPGLAVTPAFALPASGATRDLVFHINDEGDHLTIVLRHRPSAMTELLAERLGGHLRTIVEAIVDDPDQRIDRLPLLTGPERTELAPPARPDDSHDSGDGDDSGDGVPLSERFAARARSHPDAVAIAAGPVEYSYRELERYADAVARRLRAAGAGAGTVVATHLDLSPGLVAGLLGIGAIGAAFVIVDPSRPESERAALLTAADARWCLHGPDQQLPLPAGVRPVALPRPDEVAATDQVAPPRPGRTAYLTVARGTGDSPVCVEVDHRALSHRLAAVGTLTGLGASSRILADTRLAGEAVELELLLPLAAGATLVIPRPWPAATPMPRRLLYEITGPRRIADRRLSYVCVPYGGGTAIVYRALADALPADCSLYAVEIPGHDPALREPLEPIEVVAERCAREILELVVGPLVIYGHCVGSALATAIARRLEAAGRPIDAVYLGANFPFARPPDRVLRAVAWLTGRDWLRSDQLYANWLQSMGADLSGLDANQLATVVRTMRHDARAAEAYFTGLIRRPAEPLSAPVIAVVGNQDTQTEYFQERFRDWHLVAASTALVVVDEAGHYFMRYRPAELAEIVTTTHTALAAGTNATLAVESRGPNPSWWLADVSEAPSPDAPSPDVPAAGSGSRRPLPSASRFLTVATAQLVSIVGSALSEFAISLWIYVTTGSLVWFALFSAMIMLPGLVVAPVAGAVVDRYDRRRVMLTSDAAAAALQLALALLYFSGRLRVDYLPLIVIGLSVALTFQRLSFTAAVPQLTPKIYLGHASGFVQLAGGVAQFVVPLAAVGLLAQVGLGGVLVLDVGSFGVCLLVVALVRFPAAMPYTRREPLTTEIARGFRLVTGHRGLRAMLGYMAALNVFLSPLLLLVSPLVLAFAPLSSVGVVALLGGFGAVAGGLVMGVWGGPRHRRMVAVLACGSLLGVFAAVTGLRPSTPLVAVGLFGMYFCLSVFMGVYTAIVFVKVPQRLHGRVFALNQMLAWSTIPLAWVVIAPLGPRLLNPLLLPHGPLAGTVGVVLGVGEGRGTGLMYVLFGLAMVVLSLLARRLPALARFDREVPDATADDLVGVEARQNRPARPVSDGGQR